MRRRDLSTVASADIEHRLRIALGKMTARQGDIFLSIRFDQTPYEELAARHGITTNQVITDFARALCKWSRCLHARFPSLVWLWL
ncbi:MAG TPA: hypothetical protein VK913_02470, partial [Erythrobacter sp.]|nr:hypothetical protein [Erythrobacter sp.]